MWEMITKAAAQFSNVNWFYFSIALVLYIISIFISGARWRALLLAVKANATLKQTTLAFLAAIFVNNTTIPTKTGGEICRITLICWQAGIKIKQATVSAIYERLSEILPLIIITVLAIPALRGMMPNIKDSLSIYSLIAIAVIAALFFIARTILKSEKVRKIREELREIKITWSSFFTAVFWSSLLWIQDLLRLIIIAKSLNVTLSVTQASTLAVISIVGGMMPTIGGLGAIEGGFTTALYFFGVPVDIAIAITVLERFISYVLSTFAGGATIAALGGRKL